jgi:hypothetical protein
MHKLAKAFERTHYPLQQGSLGCLQLVTTPKNPEISKGYYERKGEKMRK